MFPWRCFLILSFFFCFILSYFSSRALMYVIYYSVIGHSNCIACTSNCNFGNFVGNVAIHFKGSSATALFRHLHLLKIVPHAWVIWNSTYLTTHLVTVDWQRTSQYQCCYINADRHASQLSTNSSNFKSWRKTPLGIEPLSYLIQGRLSHHSGVGAVTHW